MSTKAEVINEAYSQLRISGLTVQPSASDYALALRRLESMMAALLQQFNMAINYNFENTPNVNSPTGVNLSFFDMMVTNLAVRLLPDFGKEVPQVLAMQASQSVSNAIGVVAAANMRMIQPSRRMPVGSGNTFRGLWWNRFSTPVVNAPVAPETKYITQGETLDFYEDFSAFLGNATIFSYTIESDILLTIDASANVSPRITYTVTAPLQQTASTPFQQVLITITDSTGQTLLRFVNFEVTMLTELPGA